MKNTILISFLMLVCISLFGQLRLDVVGDAKIAGRLDLKDGPIGASVFIGNEAGLNNNLGGSNTFVGVFAGQANTSGNFNSFFGRSAGNQNVSGSSNAFFGMQSGEKNVDGGGNSYYGAFSGFSNTSGANNAFFGTSAGALNVLGTANAFFGYDTGRNNVNGTRNTFLGMDADMTGTDSLDRAIAIGHNAMVGCHNCAVIGGTGVDAVNVGIGTAFPTEALEVVGNTKFLGKLDMTIGDDNVFIGKNVGNPNLGKQNTFIGTEAGNKNSTGNENAFFGRRAGYNNTSGYGNTFIGRNAGFSNTEGFFNTLIGMQAAFAGKKGKRNTIIGLSAGYHNDGDENVFVGNSAGAENRIGDRNTFLGTRAGLTSITDTLDNAIAIGYQAKVGCSNCAVIGGLDADAVNVGIGTDNPQEDLEIKDKDFASFRITRDSASTFLEQNSFGGALSLEHISKIRTVNISSYEDSYFNGGKVGIGIFNPERLLHLREGISGATSNANAIGVFERDNHAYLNILTPGANESGVLFGNPSSNAAGGVLYNSNMPNGLEFRTNGNQFQVSIDSTGRVGIGSNDPSAPLTVRARSATTFPEENGIHLFNPIDSTDEAAIIQARVAGSFAGNPFLSLDIFGEGGWSMGVDNQDDNKLKFSNNPENLGAAPKMTIDTDGDVGIGTTDPQKTLHVNGRVRIEDVPEGFGALLLIDSNGDLVKQSASARNNNSPVDNPFFSEQKELLNTIRNENTELKQSMKDQQIQINELKSLVEQLLAERSEAPKNNTHLLRLEQNALLAQNQPNPFRENTFVNYFIPADVKRAQLQVTNLDGKVIAQLPLNETGNGQVTIQSKSYPAGTYFYSLILDGKVSETKRMVLTR